MLQESRRVGGKGLFAHGGLVAPPRSAHSYRLCLFRRLTRFRVSRHVIQTGAVGVPGRRTGCFAHPKMCEGTITRRR